MPGPPGPHSPASPLDALGHPRRPPRRTPGNSLASRGVPCHARGDPAEARHAGAGVERREVRHLCPFTYDRFMIVKTSGPSSVHDVRQQDGGIMAQICRGGAYDGMRILGAEDVISCRENEGVVVDDSSGGGGDIRRTLAQSAVDSFLEGF